MHATAPLLPESLPHAGIGEALRGAREAHGVTIEQAARSLHIRINYLRMLEEGALEALPGNAYARGYLRRYAAWLGLNPEEIMREADEAGKLPPRRFLALPSYLKRDPHPSPAIVMTASFLAVLLAGIWIIAQPSVPAPEAVDTVARWKRERAHVAAMRQGEKLCGQGRMYYPACFRVVDAVNWPKPLAFSPERPMGTIMELAYPHD